MLGKGLGFRIQGLGFRAWGLGLRVGARVRMSGFIFDAGEGGRSTLVPTSRKPMYTYKGIFHH